MRPRPEWPETASAAWRRGARPDSLRLDRTAVSGAGCTRETETTKLNPRLAGGSLRLTAASLTWSVHPQPAPGTPGGR